MFVETSKGVIQSQIRTRIAPIKDQKLLAGSQSWANTKFCLGFISYSAGIPLVSS